MTTQLPFTLENSLGWPIRGVVRWATPTVNPADCPAVVLCHGFKGFKDWGHFPWVADRLAESGFRVVSFNFGGSGVDEVADQFTRLDRFRRNTLSLEVEELSLVLKALGQGRLPGGGPPAGGVGLLGHSRGSIATSVLASRHEGVRALVIWAGIGSLEERYPEAVRRGWREAGELDIVNARTGQRMPIGLEALDDLERHLDDYAPLRLLPTVTIPTLWIHGGRDATIPVDEVRIVDSAVAGRRAGWRFVVLDDGDHTFGSVHPFAGVAPPLEEAVRITERFFGEALRAEVGGK